MASQNNTAQQKIITTFVVMVVIAALVVGIHSSNKKAPNATSQPAVASAPATATSNAGGTYRDGSYQADGNYSSPGGKESVGVSLTLAGNKVTDATVTGKADSGVAQIYQSYFIKGYKSSVVGKNVNDIKLSRVAGSSLTSKGFNDALIKIKQQAKG